MDECGATLILADDFGDNECTIRCQLGKGHSGKHVERFERDETPVEIYFECDEREESKP